MGSKKKVLIFIVSYNAEKFIGAVLQRIPVSVWNNNRYETEVLVIDDESSDSTFFRALDYQREHASYPLTILRNAKIRAMGEIKNSVTITPSSMGLM